MQLRSENKATPIEEYEPLLLPCYHQNELHMITASFIMEGSSYFSLVNPNSLNTLTVLQGEVVARKDPTDTNKNGYIDDESITHTPFNLALKKVLGLKDGSIENNGIIHSMRTHGPNEVFLTIDMCPSRRLFERAFFEKLAYLGSIGKPVPVTIFVSLFWLINHQEELDWILEHVPLVTFGIHCSSHLYVHGREFNKNFLLDPHTNLDYELFGVQKYFLRRGMPAPVFFRAPGLVTDEKIIKVLCKYGLILIGADAWLAKGQVPSSGGIILVHGNSNETAGIDIVMTYLESDEFVFLALREAIPSSQEVGEYLNNDTAEDQSTKFCQPCCAPFFSKPMVVDAGEETDEDAEEALCRDTRACLPEGNLSWQKPANSLPGIRKLEAAVFKNPHERLTLFNRLTRNEYKIQQVRDQHGVSIEVQVPTILTRLK